MLLVRKLCLVSFAGLFSLPTASSRPEAGEDYSPNGSGSSPLLGRSGPRPPGHLHSRVERLRILRTSHGGGDPAILGEMLDTLKVLQDEYFEPWQGTWPAAIDWTAAVVGTHVSGALNSLSQSLDLISAARDEESDEYGSEDKAKENLIALYFSQVLSFYFGQNSVDIRNQAFDDMLWVVLGWLEAIQFIDLHTALYYAGKESLRDSARQSAKGLSQRPLLGQQQLTDGSSKRTYFGNVWTPAFAHRARVFWDLAAKGWDTKYCGGGMTWNPRLQVYKNAITNELFSAASVSMYLYFPGDDNTSPFGRHSGSHEPTGRRDVKHLDAAMAGHIWLRDSGMRNPPDRYQGGLYADGFHISGWGDRRSNNTKCDVRNAMVYTYNQGVILTALRGLWKVRRDEPYLKEGHDLIRSVVKATGYSLARDEPVDRLKDLRPGQLPPWHGLGRAGVMEDQCDVSATCSQDSQTFKGIFFHHLSAFCAPLEMPHSHSAHGGQDEAAAHSSACRSYLGWVAHNARAAMATRDDNGRFGMWWTAGLLEISSADLVGADFGFKTGGDGDGDGDGGGDGGGDGDDDGDDDDEVDYRSYGVPNDDMWVPHGGARHEHGNGNGNGKGKGNGNRNGHGKLAAGPAGDGAFRRLKVRWASAASDPNDRGRGRTVETQAGGLAVLRAWWEVANRT